MRISWNIEKLQPLLTQISGILYNIRSSLANTEIENSHDKVSFILNS